MLKFDFNTYVEKYLNRYYYGDLLQRKDAIVKELNNCQMIGWLKDVDLTSLKELEDTATNIKANSKCLVVIGIGGSYLGSYALNEAFKSYFNDTSFPIIYAGISFSSKYMTDLLAYLKTTDFTLNVISKSGTTLETNLTYKLIKSLMIEKYSPEELQKRIIITTDASSGKLKSDATSNGYKTFVIPNDIGGRYSLMTPAHLLPLALNINITNLAKGYNNGKTYLNYAYLYAINRVSLYQSNKYVENFVVYENNLLPLTEWLKQLFAETEGKNGKGIFPVSTLNTRDLHSLGQFIQEGTPILFETVLQVEKSSELKISDDLTLHGLNNKVAEAVTIAHNKGEVPINLITIPEINEYNLGELIYFFMLSAAFSGLMFGIDPFNQPGVEVYKKEEREMIKLDV